MAGNTLKVALFQSVVVMPWKRAITCTFIDRLQSSVFLKARLLESSQPYRNRSVAGKRRGCQFTERYVRALRARYLRSSFANPPEADTADRDFIFKIFREGREKNTGLRIQNTGDRRDFHHEVHESRQRRTSRGYGGFGRQARGRKEKSGGTLKGELG